MTSHSKGEGDPGWCDDVRRIAGEGEGRVKCCDVTQGTLATAGMQYKNCANQ